MPQPNPSTTKPNTKKGKIAPFKSISRSVRAGLQFPVGRIARKLKQGKYAPRIGEGAPVYLVCDSFFVIEWKGFFVFK